MAENESERSNEHFLETTSGFVVVMFLVMLIYFGGGYLMWSHYFRNTPSNAGTFGDMFGGITSFFSAVTVILVFYAARLQKKELNDTRDEMKAQTNISLELSEAAVRQSESASKQNKNLVLQRFENTLFNLIGIYLQTVDSLKAPSHKTGKAVFPDELSNYYIPKFSNQFGHVLNFFVEDYGMFIEIYNKPKSVGEIDKFTHYYKHIVNIITFIKDATLSKKRRVFYLNTFISLLSPHELTLLYFYIAFDKNINDTAEGSQIQSFCKTFRVFDGVSNLPNVSYKRIIDRWPS